MGHLSEGRLVAYLDDALAAAEKRAAEAHLDQCDRCRSHLERLRSQSDQVGDLLETLSPGAFDAPDRQRALQTIRMTLEQRRKESMLEMFRTNKTAQRTAVGAITVLVVAGLLAFAPVRALASEFLSLFRVERFAVVNVDSDRLEEIAQALDENMSAAEGDVEEAVGDSYPVSSLAEAADAVGFTPLVPAGYGDPDSIEVTEGGTVTYTPDIQSLRAVFSALNMDPDLLPENIDGQPFTITVPAGVALSYGDGEEGFGVIQMTSPTVDVPEGVDMQALGEAMLQVYGMSPREARRLSRSIDWTTTLVLPIPTDIASVSEITVNGHTGLLFDRANMSEDVDGEGGALLWEADGTVYMVAGAGSSISLMDIATSLQ